MIGLIERTVERFGQLDYAFNNAGVSQHRTPLIELDAVTDSDERERLFETFVGVAYERGRGLNMAAYGEIDDVIDPADSRRWISMLFDQHATPWWKRDVKSRPFVDAW